MRKLALLCLLFTSLLLSTVWAQSTPSILYPLSPLRVPIPLSAQYTQETRIVSIRQTYVDYSGSSCRVPDGTVVPLVSVTVNGGTPRLPQAIPTSCNPDGGSDAHMVVANYQTGQVYEFFQAVWNANHTAITANGNVTYAIDGTGITPNANQRTTAAGLSLAVGQVRIEDLTASCDTTIPHALTMAVPSSFLNGSPTTGYVPPAVGAETQGTAGANGIRMGELYSIPRSVDVNSMSNISPFTRTILRTIQQYGVMIADGGGQTSGGKAIGVFRNEPNALETVCGLNSDDLIPQVQREIGAVILQYSLFRVTFDSGSITRTPVATRTPATTLTPIATLPTRTPTRTPLPSGTPIVTTPFTFSCVVTTPNPFTAICH